MRVIVVDDDTLVALSLKTILEATKEIEIVAIGHDGNEAVDLYREHKPDILLVDIQMKTMSGLAAAEEILKQDPDAKILFLTTFLDDEYITKALRIGAKGYILKQEFEAIAPALKAVESGQNVFGNTVLNKIPELVQKKETFDYQALGITEKELEIIENVAQGLNNKEIAKKLFLSEGTVRNYISTVLEKLELRDRTQLAIFWYQHKN